MKIHIVYFSATYTTRTVCQRVARNIGGDVIVHDITDRIPTHDVVIPQDELLIVGAPVYCGRIPEMAAERLAYFHGEGGKAISLVVYGNRAYDDALLELNNLTMSNGFQVVASAAFIGRHCIFPTVATHRPDAGDDEKIKEFAAHCNELLKMDSTHLTEVVVPGNPAYCPHKRSAFCPAPTDNCTNCGTCAELCPTGAISLSDARQVNPDLCIACGRCVLVCTQNGRSFSGDAYNAMSVKFTQAYGARREPEFFFAHSL